MIELLVILSVLALATAPLVLVFAIVTAPAYDPTAIPLAQCAQVPLLLILSIVGWTFLHRKIIGGFK